MLSTRGVSETNDAFIKASGARVPPEYQAVAVRIDYNNFINEYMNEEINEWFDDTMNEWLNPNSSRLALRARYGWRMKKWPNEGSKCYLSGLRDDTAEYLTDSMSHIACLVQNIYMKSSGHTHMSPTITVAIMTTQIECEKRSQC